MVTDPNFDACTAGSRGEDISPRFTSSPDFRSNRQRPLPQPLATERQSPHRLLLSDPIASLRRAAERGRTTRQFNLFAGVADLGSVYLQDRDIAVDEVADIGISAVRRKDDTLGKTTDFNFAYFCNLLDRKSV